MHKKYNLAVGDGFSENMFLEMIYTSSFRKNSPVESVFPGCTNVYHVLDSTATFDRQLKPNVMDSLRRTSINPFLEIYASNQGKIKRAVSLLEEMTHYKLKETKRE